jgi:hypothetical protein
MPVLLKASGAIKKEFLKAASDCKKGVQKAAWVENLLLNTSSRFQKLVHIAASSLHRPVSDRISSFLITLN